MSDPYEPINEMIDLCREKVRLLIQLRKALRLADLVGRKPNEIKVSMRTSIIKSGSSFRPWKDALFRVQIGDEPEQTFPLEDVHMDLWPDDLRQQFEQHMRRIERRRNGR